MRAWLAVLTLLFVAWLCGCATWPDDDAFDRLVAGFEKARIAADRGDQSAKEFVGAMDFFTRMSRIAPKLRRLPGHYTAARLVCYKDGGTGQVELPIPAHPDNTVTVNQMLECLEGLNPKMQLDLVLPVHAMWEHCLNYITDSDHRIAELEQKFREQGIEEPICNWKPSERLERDIDFDAEEFSATDLALTFLGLQEVPKSIWNWAWVNANILDGISPDHAFPGCNLCSGAPAGGDK